MREAREPRGAQVECHFCGDFWLSKRGRSLEGICMCFSGFLLADEDEEREVVRGRLEGTRWGVRDCVHAGVRDGIIGKK